MTADGSDARGRPTQRLLVIRFSNHSATSSGSDRIPSTHQADRATAGDVHHCRGSNPCAHGIVDHLESTGPRVQGPRAPFRARHVLSDHHACDRHRLDADAIGESADRRRDAAAPTLDPHVGITSVGAEPPVVIEQRGSATEVHPAGSDQREDQRVSPRPLRPGTTIPRPSIATAPAWMKTGSVDLAAICNSR